MHKLLLTAAAAAIGVALAAAPAAAQTLEKIKQRGVIVVGSKADYKPFGFRDPSGAIVGFEPDIARLVAEFVKMGARYVSTGTDLGFLLGAATEQARQVRGLET